MPITTRWIFKIHKHLVFPNEFVQFVGNSLNLYFLFSLSWIRHFDVITSLTTSGAKEKMHTLSVCSCICLDELVCNFQWFKTSVSARKV